MRPKTSKTNLDLARLRPLVKKYLGLALKHASFYAILAVLLIYVFVVFKISQLAGAEPSPGAETSAMAGSNIPKINKNAVAQIQSLEQNSPELHSLFDQARNNPFQE